MRAFLFLIAGSACALAQSFSSLVAAADGPDSLLFRYVDENRTAYLMRWNPAAGGVRQLGAWSADSYCPAPHISTNTFGDVIGTETTLRGIGFGCFGPNAILVAGPGWKVQFPNQSSVRISPGGRYALLGGLNLRLVDFWTSSETVHEITAAAHQVRDDGAFLAIRNEFNSLPGNVRLVYADPRGSVHEYVARGSARLSRSSLDALSLRPEPNSFLRIRLNEEGLPVEEVPAFPSSVNFTAFTTSPDGGHVFLAESGGSIFRWDGQESVPVARLDADATELALSRDERTLFAGSKAGLHRIDLDSGEVLETLSSPLFPVGRNP